MSLSFEEALRAAEEKPGALDEEGLATLLAADGEEQLQALYSAAYRVKERIIGRNVSIRALVEISNVCAKDCHYCGIRKSNAACHRYSLGFEEIVSAAKKARSLGFASLVLQGGEIESEERTRFIEDILEQIRPLDMGVTLSLGEQEPSVYERWKAAGATRYLLRIETSSPEKYALIHPADHSWQRRRQCLVELGRLGYQVGTGVMTGLPGHDLRDLARDIMFYREIDADMIGMGPYIVHPGTPLGEGRTTDRVAALELGLKAIAVTRLHLHDVNIAAATALQALASDGRERGLLAGANVIMPNFTELEYRKEYSLYEGKVAAGNFELSALDRRIAAIGEKILYNQRGDTKHKKMLQ